MTDRQIQLIEETWDYVILNTEKAGELFYTRLFERYPEVRPLFKSSMDEQSRKLIALITFAVNKLRNLDTIVADVQALGKRHVAYGVDASHYQMVGECLLWTLEQGLAEQWNEEVKQAWTALYVTLAEIMMKVAEKP